MLDRYTLTQNDKGRPAIVVTTTGGLVAWCHTRWDVQAFLERLTAGYDRFPGLLAAWDGHAGPERPQTGGTVNDALALVASFPRRSPR
jgi:hypothetical protein